MRAPCVTTSPPPSCAAPSSIRRGSRQQAGCDVARGSWCAPAEVAPAGARPERSLDVVVDHEGRVKLAEAAAGLDQLVGGGTFAAELHDRRTALDRGTGAREV